MVTGCNVQVSPQSQLIHQQAANNAKNFVV